MRLHVLALSLIVVFPGNQAQASSSLVMDTDQPKAVLNIVSKKASNAPITDSDWTTLFETDGYVRLKQREAAMKREFTDQEFRDFVLSDEVAAKATELRDALEGWSSIDLEVPRAAASAYLPEGAVLRATIYPVIKPKTNSFVFDLSTNPAIFLYLDPLVPPQKLSNTLAHELHHIGFGTRCPEPAAEKAIGALSEDQGWVIRRLGAFGEGFAMLAAAGGPDQHPHAASPREDRERWDRDVARAGEDMEKVERFIIDSVSGKLSGEERQATFFSFYGEQGPWYTVGWLMASTIEKELGRKGLLDAFCDPRQLLPAYNRAAALTNARESAHLPVWSPAVLESLQAPH